MIHTQFLHDDFCCHFESFILPKHCEVLEKSLEDFVENCKPSKLHANKKSTSIQIKSSRIGVTRRFTHTAGCHHAPLPHSNRAMSPSKNCQKTANAKTEIVDELLTELLHQATCAHDAGQQSPGVKSPTPGSSLNWMV